VHEKRYHRQLQRSRFLIAPAYADRCSAFTESIPLKSSASFVFLRRTIPPPLDRELTGAALEVDDFGVVHTCAPSATARIAGSRDEFIKSAENELAKE
jgi:hypothetical protein